MVERYWWTTAWFGPAVREMALSQSSPTPMTRELLIVVTSDAAGAPGLAFPVPIAPMAPEPFVPAVFTPVKLMTVIDATTLFEIVAVAVTPLSAEVANARQISAVPRWTFVLSTRAHVNPPPATLLTETLVPLPGSSVEMNARSSSFAEAVANDGDAIVVALVPRSVDSVTSIATVAGVTVRTVEPLMEPDVARMVEVPNPTPVARPALLIVAVALVTDVQVTEFVRFCVLLSVYVPVAVNCYVVPLRNRRIGRRHRD